MPILAITLTEGAKSFCKRLYGNVTLRLESEGSTSFKHILQGNGAKFQSVAKGCSPEHIHIRVNVVGILMFFIGEEIVIFKDIPSAGGSRQEIAGNHLLVIPRCAIGGCVRGLLEGCDNGVSEHLHSE